MAQVTPAETLDVLQREKISSEPEVRIELQQLERQQRRGDIFFFQKREVGNLQMPGGDCTS